jgi:hypothetical protein
MDPSDTLLAVGSNIGVPRYTPFTEVYSPSSLSDSYMRTVLECRYRKYKKPGAGGYFETTYKNISDYLSTATNIDEWCPCGDDDWDCMSNCGDIPCPDPKVGMRVAAWSLNGWTETTETGLSMPSASFGSNDFWAEGIPVSAKKPCSTRFHLTDAEDISFIMNQGKTLVLEVWWAPLGFSSSFVTAVWVWWAPYFSVDYLQCSGSPNCGCLLGRGPTIGSDPYAYTACGEHPLAPCDAPEDFPGYEMLLSVAIDGSNSVTDADGKVVELISQSINLPDFFDKQTLEAYVHAASGVCRSCFLPGFYTCVPSWLSPDAMFQVSNLYYGGYNPGGDTVTRAYFTEAMEYS